MSRKDQVISPRRERKKNNLKRSFRYWINHARKMGEKFWNESDTGEIQLKRERKNTRKTILELEGKKVKFFVAATRGHRREIKSVIDLLFWLVFNFKEIIFSDTILVRYIFEKRF